MSARQPQVEPVVDTTPKVDDAISVGEDLAFQRKWWRFENLAWCLLVVALLADALGLLGRGWLARAERATPDGALQVRYERVERAGTPSEMTLTFHQLAAAEQDIRLVVSPSVVKQMGARRVIPQPAQSLLGPGGITYVFPATGAPATVSFSLEPSFPGMQHVTLTVPGEQPIRLRILVLP